MPDCELIPTCAFFNDRMANMPSVAGIYKKRYCKDDCFGCARYRVFAEMGRDAVPANLYPNEADRAAEMLADR